MRFNGLLTALTLCSVVVLNGTSWLAVSEIAYLLSLFLYFRVNLSSSLDFSANELLTLYWDDDNRFKRYYLSIFSLFIGLSVSALLIFFTDRHWLNITACLCLLFIVTAYLSYYSNQSIQQKNIENEHVAHAQHIVFDKMETVNQKRDVFFSDTLTFFSVLLLSVFWLVSLIKLTPNYWFYFYGIPFSLYGGYFLFSFEKQKAPNANFRLFYDVTFCGIFIVSLLAGFISSFLTPLFILIHYSKTSFSLDYNEATV